MNIDLQRMLAAEERRKKARNQMILVGGIGAAALVCIGVICVCAGISRRQNLPVDGTPVITEAQPEDTSAGQSESQTEKGQLGPISITISAMGDCTLGTDVNFNPSSSLNAYYDMNGADYFFANVRSILEKDDLSIVNFEGTLTESSDRVENLYAFKGPAEYAAILSGSSVEAANLANNHSHDYGEQGFTDTQTALAAAEITTFGYDETAVVEAKGIKVGLVGIYELRDHLERSTQVIDNIQTVKNQGAQLVIVVFHWGNEKETMPDSNQVTLAHLAIDNGADLVVGHHPHVLQGIEKYKDKYICYSLGNFCFGGNNNPTDKDTMIFQQTFTVDSNGVAADDNTNIIPCSVSSETGLNNYQPTPAQGDEAERILNKIEERSQGLSRE